MAEVTMKSLKHSIVARTNTFIVATVAVSVFVVVFCGFAAKSLVSQSMYQRRVITAKEKALDTLIANEEVARTLKDRYVAFATQQINVLGGNPTGEGPLDGDNPRIILDALPSEYDFPGLSSSVEKILVEGAYQIDSIGGQEALTGTNVASTASVPSASQTQATSGAIEIPYPIVVSADPNKTKELLLIFERSIRPFKVNSLNFTAQSGQLNTTINLSTFYLPESGMRVSEEIIK